MHKTIKVFNCFQSGRTVLPTRWQRVSDGAFQHILAKIWYRHHFYFTQSDRSVVYLLVVSIFISLMASFLCPYLLPYFLQRNVCLL